MYKFSFLWNFVVKFAFLNIVISAAIMFVFFRGMKFPKQELMDIGYKMVECFR